MAEPALVVRGPAKRGDDFVEAARGLVVATMLAALAGMVDAIGYLHLKGLVALYEPNHQARGGSRARRPGRGGDHRPNWSRCSYSGPPPAKCWPISPGRWHTTCVLIGVALFLAIAAVLATTPDPMVFAMGALNASMHRAGVITPPPICRGPGSTEFFSPVAASIA